MNKPTLNVLTDEDLKIEWNYRYEERLAIMAGAREPTGDRAIVAMQEADEAIEKLKA